jgi:enamine deaminase RidA (YjgF/YER057c/UK114 family)
MRAALAIIPFSLWIGAAAAQDIVRHPVPDSDFPISRAVEIPAGAQIVHLSGAVPTRPPASSADVTTGYGTTQSQTVSVLSSIDATLADLDLSMSDVFRMQVFLVAPPGEAAMDFEGFMQGYIQFFRDGADLPVRTVVEVAGLAHPDWLVEIEVSAVRPSGAD